MQAANEAPDFFFGRRCGAPLVCITRTTFQIATGTEGVEQKRSDTLEIGGRSWDVLLRFYEGFRIARELV